MQSKRFFFHHKSDTVQLDISKFVFSKKFGLVHPSPPLSNGLIIVRTGLAPL